MSIIQDDCFFYIENGVPFEEARILAACKECKLQNVIPGDPMYWPGKETGYGDYDLYCSICKKAIHVREEYENKTTI